MRSLGVLIYPDGSMAEIVAWGDRPCDAIAINRLTVPRKLEWLFIAR